MPEFTLASVLTIVGASAAAALVTSVVQLLKTVLPIIAARGWEQPLALILAAVLVTAATADAGAVTPNAILLAVLAWVWIGKGATQVYDKALDVKTAMAGG